LRARADDLREAQAALEQTAAELRAANEELRTRGEELDRLNRELRRLDEMKSNLLGNVSHELQTPLVSIRGYTEMTLKERLGPITEEQRYGLGLSLKNIDRLIAMIDNLVNFARKEQEIGPLELSRFPLLPLIEEAAELVRATREERRIELRLDAPPGAWLVEGDRDKILQVFLNLLSNAIKFNREAGRIEVLVRRGQPGFVSVSVRDTGIGIPDKDLPLVFDRHYRVAPQGEGRRAGSGIGLSIVRDVLRQHGCTISVSSAEGQGTEFTFTLPEAEAAGARPQPAEVEPRAPGSGSGDDEAPDGPGREPRFRVIRR
jgi:signal transduction histidine kinase